jgi:hypothetical protein
VVIYSTIDLLDGAYDLESYYENLGEVVGGLIFQGYEPDMAQAIKEDIAGYNASFGTQRFHLVGDWESVGQLSDQWYADVDGDSVPDVEVTRWPASNSGEVVDMVVKMSLYRSFLDQMGLPDAATFLVGDVNLQSNSGELARWCSEQVEAALPVGGASVVTSRLLMSAHPGASERNTATANLLNEKRPALISILSTTSTQDAPGCFFTRMDTPCPPFQTHGQWACCPLDGLCA